MIFFFHTVILPLTPDLFFYGLMIISPDRHLSGEVEFDEVYVVAGHKGYPQTVAAKARKGRRNRLKRSRGRGTLAKEKPPILGLIERNGEVIIKMLANRQQDSIKPIKK